MYHRGFTFKIVSAVDEHFAMNYRLNNYFTEPTWFIIFLNYSQLTFII